MRDVGSYLPTKLAKCEPWLLRLLQQVPKLPFHGRPTPEADVPAEAVGTAFVPLIEAAIAEYVAKWQVRAPPGRLLAPSRAWGT